MSLEKYKICPVCGKHNPPNLMECRECETDLTGIKPVDETSETNTLSSDTAENHTVRICECGMHNPPQARKCSACGEDISDILPTQTSDQIASDTAVLVLTSVDDSFSVKITETGTVIGREADLREYLSDKLYVSRQHAELTLTADGAFIKNLSRSNHTFLNNVLIENEIPAALHTGDEIGLGGIVINGSRQEHAAYFICEVKK